MTSDLLSLLAGAVLSALFSYVPGLNTWFAKLENTRKRLIMLGALALTAGAVYGLACLGWAADLGINLVCDQAGLKELIKAFLLALAANQAAYSITPLPAKVEAAGK